MKTRVFITIDTEFSIAGTFADPVGRRPVGPQSVLCDVGGRSQGLGFLLETFSRFGIAATFFVEAFNSYYFGDEPMRGLALRIKAAGHDVQLHLHPCWTYFRNADWVERLKIDPPTDHMHGRSLAVTAQWLSEGIAIFERWGLGRPVALRTGNLMADTNVYRAMEQAGILIGSNIGLAIHRPAEAELQLFSGFHRVGGVTEACVLTYVDFAIGRRTHYKSLTITGSSWQEIRTLLQRAREANVPSVVILTHPFEFVRRRDRAAAELEPNALNQRRLARLCEFLRAHPDQFEAATIGSLAPSLAQLPTGTNAVLSVPAARTVQRFVQNAINSGIVTL